MDGARILLAGEVLHVGRAIGWALEHQGHRVSSAATPEAAIEGMVTKNYDLLLYVLNSEDGGYSEVIRKARKFNPEIKIILVTAGPHGTFPLEVFRLEVDDYLVMPCSSAELNRRVGYCLKSAPPSSVEVLAIDPGVGAPEFLNNHLLSFCHDIRGSLVAVAASLKLITRGTYGAVTRPVNEKLKELDRRLQKVMRISEEFIEEALTELPPEQDREHTWDLRQDVVEPVLQECAEDIFAHGIILHNRLNSWPDAAIFLRGNKFWLRSVIRNLLTNAIKHGGRGCTITLDLKKQGAVYYLQVANTGRPMTVPSGSRFYGPPPRLARKGRSKSGGLGLGLYLPRDLVKRHGGDIWYESGPEGTNFVVALPKC